MARFTALSQEYLAQIDQEISRLQQLREQIAATLEAEAQVNTNRKRSVAPKRRLSRGGPSAAGRLAIAEAQRKRWAAKKAADKKLTKRTSGKKAGAKRTAKAPAAKSAE